MLKMFDTWTVLIGSVRTERYSLVLMMNDIPTDIADIFVYESLSHITVIKWKNDFFSDCYNICPQQ